MAKGRRRRGAAPADSDAITDSADSGGSGPDGAGAEDAGDGAGAKMLQNSLFLMASAGLTAGIGFIFWALVAHLYSSTQIGLATTLLSAISLISFLSTFGFGATMIRYQAEGEARHRQVSVMLALVAVASFVIGTGYILAVKLISPDLAFVHDKPLYALVLVVVCVFATVNLVTDSVFLAARRAEYNTLVDGFIQSLTKLVIPTFVVGMGAMGIVAATGLGYVVATLASIYYMYRKLDFRFSFRLGGTRIRETASYSATTQFSSLLNLIPQLALPIIVLRWLGPDDVTYYYLASQIAALLSTGSYAIGNALFSEGAHDPAQLRGLMMRSAKIMTAVMIPGVAVVVLVREPLLSLFGSKYPGHAQGLLTVLALGALAVAFHTWASSALRITGRMKPLLGSNLVYMVTTLGLALGFAHQGLNWVGWSWALGNLASGLFAVAFVPGANMAALAAEHEEHEALEPDEDRVPAGVGAAEPRSAPREQPRPRHSPWVGVGDSTAITEPMFFPWNRPEVRGRSDRFERFGSDDDGGAAPRPYGRQGWQPTRTGGLRVRPRAMPRQAGPERQDPETRRAGSGGGAGLPGRAPTPPSEAQTEIIRAINVPDSFFRPEPEPKPAPKPKPKDGSPLPEPRGGDAAQGLPADDRPPPDEADHWRPPGR